MDKTNCQGWILMRQWLGSMKHGPLKHTTPGRLRQTSNIYTGNIGVVVCGGRCCPINRRGHGTQETGSKSKHHINADALSPH